MDNVSFTIEEENLICFYQQGRPPQDDCSDLRRAAGYGRRYASAGGADDP